MPGLDQVLGGGVPRSGMYFIVGAPGAGKTILSLQMAFGTARSGQPVIFLTTLSESHNRLVAHASTLAFFDPDVLGNGLELINLRSLIGSGSGLSVDSLIAEVRKSRAALVIIDGFGGMRGLFDSEASAREFLYELGAKLSLLDVTLLVSIQADPRESALHPELTVADGLIGLFYERHGSGHRRYLEALKLRGARHLAGLHTLTITPDGMVCYPQLESLPVEAAPRFGSARIQFGLPELDRMLGGGLNEGTTTMLAGSPGTGKTLACVHFLVAGAAVGDPGLLLSFHESQPQLLAKAAAFGLDLASHVEQGTICIVACPPVWIDPDIVASQLRDAVDNNAIRRLVIDSSFELERSLQPVRASGFLAALVAYLRAKGITALLTRELPKIVGSELDFSEMAAAVLTENVILFRHVEYRAELHRVLSVLKMRFSEHDRSLREFVIDEGGISVLDKLGSAEGILTGIARRLESEPR